MNDYHPQSKSREDTGPNSGPMRQRSERKRSGSTIEAGRRVQAGTGLEWLLPDISTPALLKSVSNCKGKFCMPEIT